MKRIAIMMMVLALVPLLARAQYSGETCASATETEPNNDWTQANLLENGTTINAEMGKTVDGQTDVLDWYKIVVPEEGTVTLTTNSESPLRLGRLKVYVLKENGELAVRNDQDMDDYDQDRSVEFSTSDIKGGTYYISLGHYRGSGSYTLKYEFTPCNMANDPEPNDDWTQASLIESGVTNEGRMAYCTLAGDRDVIDWYKIEVPEEGTVTITTKSEPTMRLGHIKVHVLNANGELVVRNDMDMDDYDQDRSVEFTTSDIKGGTYYISLGHYRGNGGYTLKYEFTPCNIANDPEPNDDWTQASLIESGVTNEGRMAYCTLSGDRDVIDWYKIEVPEEGTVTFSTKSEPTMRLGYLNVYVLNEEGSELIRRSSQEIDDYGDNRTMEFKIDDIKGGTYYISLGHYRGNGGYTLKYEFTPCNMANDPEPNNDWTQASLIESGVTNEGRMAYCTLSGDRDVIDWYKIEVPEDGIVTFTTRPEPTMRLGYLNLYVLNEEGSELIRRSSQDMDDYGDNRDIECKLVDMKAGTYYLSLGHYRGNGGYTLKYEFTPCNMANDPEPNDVWTEASLLTNGQNLQGHLGHFALPSDADNTDWYKIELPADGSVNFAVHCERTMRMGYLSINTLNEDGEGITTRASKDMDDYGNDTTIVFTVNDLAAGTYYVSQSRYRGYGGYTLNYRYNKNTYYREGVDNTTSAKALKLEEGKPVSQTMGYYYNTNPATEHWYDLGVHSKEVVDVTIAPDTVRSLVIGVVEFYKWDGTYDDNGNPRLTYLKGDRVERSRITTSYMVNDENVHLFFRVPKYGGYGGYKIFMGQENDGNETDSPLLAEGYKGLSLMVGGRNTVRKGVPCENSITISNMSDTPTIPAMLLFNFSDDVNLIGFRLPGDRGTQYVPADSILVDYEDAENAALFDIPRLEPWESYTFYMITEGEGDIAYAPYVGSDYYTAGIDGKQRIAVSTATCVAVGFVISCVKDMVDSKIGTDALMVEAINKAVGLNSKEDEQLRTLYGQTREQYYQKDPSMRAFVAKSVLKTTCTKAINLIPVFGPAINEVGKKIDFAGGILTKLRRRLWYMIYKDLGYIKDDVEVVGAKRAINDVVASWDPNEMVGPQGVGDNHYIGQTQTINYTIMFENKAEAGAPAYRVRISDELDENVFDVSSVKFGITSHDADGYKWEMTRDGNKLSWDIKGIELPPNVNAPEGEGYVTFSVDLKPGLADGTKIANKATIIFDKNFPIETNEFVNTLDLVAPVTTMAQASYDKELGGIKVECNSSDAASGVDSYQLFVSTNGGDYTFVGNFPSTPFYPVEESNGITYGFYVLATDAVGNTEVVIPEAINFENITGIRLLTAKEMAADKRVYTIDGKFVGNTLEGLTRGTYIRGGKKVIVK